MSKVWSLVWTELYGRPADARSKPHGAGDGGDSRDVEKAFGPMRNVLPFIALVGLAIAWLLLVASAARLVWLAWKLYRNWRVK